jgi:beta-aspartyl-dipeptidase (metallo-type)
MTPEAGCVTLRGVPAPFPPVGAFSSLRRPLSMITILRNAELFTPDPVGIQSLAIAGGKIVWMGRDLPALPAALVSEEIDLGGARVIPGLVDGHAHSTGGGGEAGAKTRVPAPPLSSFTRAGVTSVVGLLGTDGETRSMQELLAHTRALNESGLSAWCYTGGYHLPGCTLTGSFRGDIVHLDRVIGVGELALSDFRSSQLTLDELLRVASEAQVGGMLAGKAGVLHLHMGDGERGLELVRQALTTSELPARTFHPTHVNRQPKLFQEALDLARGGSTVDVTCFPVDDKDPAIEASEALGLFLEADIDPALITLSSDSGGCLPTFDSEGHMTHMDVATSSSMAAALASMFDGSHAPESFLPAFTSNPARLLMLAGKGTLQTGSHADLVVLGTDHKPSSVMANGQWHVRAGEVVLRGSFEI